MHENNGKPEALLWIDFETTGVDRRKSLPLEIGMECTDMLGEQKFGSLSRIIRPDRLDILSMSPVAFSMHTDNGLLFELMGGSVRNDSMVVVANAVEEFLDSLSQRFSLVPAGPTWTSTLTSSADSTSTLTRGSPTANTTWPPSADSSPCSAPRIHTRATAARTG